MISIRKPVASVFGAMAVAAILAAAPEAHSARPDTRAMNCQQAQSLVRSRGAVVMTTGQYTYERIVAGQGYCEGDEETWIKTAPTRDDPQCRVGYYCRTRVFEPLWRWRDR